MKKMKYEIKKYERKLELFDDVEKMMKFRDLELVDVSDDIEIVDDCIVFEEVLLNKEEVKELIDLYFDTLTFWKKKVKIDEDATILIEVINEIYDDLDYLVSSLSLL